MKTCLSPYLTHHLFPVLGISQSARSNRVRPIHFTLANDRLVTFQDVNRPSERLWRNPMFFVRSFAESGNSVNVFDNVNLSVECIYDEEENGVRSNIN